MFLWCGSSILLAQTSQTDNSVEMIECTYVGISRPLYELFEETSDNTYEEEYTYKEESKDRENRPPQIFNGIITPDAVVQKEQGKYKASNIVNNWLGQSGGGYPPDPTGAAGTNHYVQAVNATPFKVFNKTTGAAVGTVKNIGALWSPPTGNMGDPIVLYDKFADRWLLSQFGSSGGSKVYIAISTTNDPTGTYYTYTFSCPQFPDYFKLSIWHDGYYMTANTSTQRIFCFQRSVMITGGTPKAFSKTFTPPTDGGFFCPLPADADGQLPPAGTPCPIFSYEDDGWGTGYSDEINIYSMTVDWTPATPTATIATQTLATAPFDGSYNASWNDIPQPGSTQKLDGIGGVFTFRAQHRVWTGYSSVVLCKGVKVSSTQRGIRWYELRRNTSTGVWSIYQQSTFSPADAYYRWCGSIAMDDYGSIGLAYAKSGGSGTSAVYPGIYYTGRRNTDPLGTMSFAETQAIAGSGTQSGTNRFGDYSHTSLDPADGTLFWHTGEYLSGGNPATRIFSFRIPYYVGIDEDNSTSVFPEVNVYKSGGQILVTASKLPSNNNMMVDLFDINGQKISGYVITPSANAIETSFNIDGLAAGTYLVRVGEPNTSFQKVSKIVID